VPKLAQVTTTATEQVVELSPKVRKQLKLKFGQYATLKQQAADIKKKMNSLKEDFEEVLAEAGVDTLDMDGNKTSIVAPIRKKFNPKLFIANGGDLDIYESALEDKRSKAYVKVTIAGEKDDSDE
jgi:hypothetical protein